MGAFSGSLYWVRVKTIQAGQISKTINHAVHTMEGIFLRQNRHASPIQAILPYELGYYSKVSPGNFGANYGL